MERIRHGDRIMKVFVSQDCQQMAREAANFGADRIREAIENEATANIVLATGTSQFEVLAALLEHDINWSLVTCFHLDEYIGLPVTHPASFRKYLKGRFVDMAKPAAFHMINAESEPEMECKRLSRIISQHPIDVAFVGIGENAHLAFNDPPADFDIEQAYICVNLDEACRQQQFKEGWFDNIDAVPKQAISMSIKQILKSKYIVCSVPDARKAAAVKASIEGPVLPEVPASILQNHGQTNLYLDTDAASLLIKSSLIEETEANING